MQSDRTQNFAVQAEDIDRRECVCGCWGPCRVLSLALVPSKGDPWTLSPALGFLLWGTQPARGTGVQSQTLGATGPNAGGRSSGKISSLSRGSRIFPFQGLCWEGMSIAHPLCFGTWQGTRSSPCSRNRWPWGKPTPLIPHKSSPVAPTPADGSSAPALPSSPPAAQHGEGGRNALHPPPPHCAVLPEPGSESPGRAREVLLQLPDEKDQERQHHHLLPHQPRVPAPGCDLQGEEREGDLRPGEQGLGEEVPAELPSQLLLHPQLVGRPEAAQGGPSTGDGIPRR